MKRVVKAIISIICGTLFISSCSNRIVLIGSDPVDYIQTDSDYYCSPFSCMGNIYRDKVFCDILFKLDATPIKKRPFYTEGYERLKKILNEKEWDLQIKRMVMELYNKIICSFDKRPFYENIDINKYLLQYVNAIESINMIVIDEDNPECIANGWAAYTSYYDDSIYLRYDNLTDLRHEISHLEYGTFLFASMVGDLAFVLEEGRASYKEGEARVDTEWFDNFDFDMSEVEGQSLLIERTGGSYPAFEDVYRSFLYLGLDMEEIRGREEARVSSMIIDEIENKLNYMYGENLGTLYIDCLNEYVLFFNEHGAMIVPENKNNETVNDVKNRLDGIYERMMLKKQEKGRSQ